MMQKAKRIWAGLACLALLGGLGLGASFLGQARAGATVGMVQAETKSGTFGVTSPNSGTLTGFPSGAQFVFKNTYANAANGQQIIGGKAMTLTLSNMGGYRIKGVTLSLKTNKKSGRGKATVTIGAREVGSLDIGTIGTKFVDRPIGIEADADIAEGEAVEIKVSATANSVYCEKMHIEYEEIPPIPQGTRFSRVKEQSGLIAGKKYLIGAANGLAVVGAQAGNVRAAVDTSAIYSPASGDILADGSLPRFVLLPMNASGAFGFYDEQSKKFLGSASSAESQLLSFDDYESPNTCATIAVSGDDSGITFGGDYAYNKLRYDAAANVFSCYVNGQSPVALFASEEAPEVYGKAWADDFNIYAGVACDNGNNPTIVADWQQIFVDDFNQKKPSLSPADILSIKYGKANAEGSEVEKALATYDYIVHKYPALEDYLGRRAFISTNESFASALHKAARDSGAGLALAIASAGLCAAGSFFFLRRRKSW